MVRLREIRYVCITNRELTKKKNPINVTRFTTSAVHMYLLTDATPPEEVSPLMSIKIYRSCQGCYGESSYLYEGDENLKGLDEEVEVEDAVVSLADAVADPGAVVVVGGHAVVALFAVLAPERLFDVADCAVLHLYEEHDILLIH